MSIPKGKAKKHNIMNIGEKLRTARVALNLSQTELGEKIGVTKRSICNYETTSTYPRPDIIKKLADALNVTVSYLMYDEETDPHKNLEQELFVANAKSKFGYKGAKEASDAITHVTALFASGELSSEAKDVFFKSLMEVYIESKNAAKEKFTPRRRKSRKAV
jgi:transcriptional regulator with XRE-family HTH domain